VQVPDPIREDLEPEEADEKAAPVASKDPASARSADAAGVGARRLDPPVSPSPKDVPRPIGPERLRALREAIRNGTYPTDADVMGGLVRMFRQPDAPDPEGEAKP
jgi:hypothetical protein